MNANTYSLQLPRAILEVSPAGARVDPPAEQLLEEAWTRCSPELARLAAALGIRSERQGDVLQDVFISARQSCPEKLNEDELRRWLFRVTANRCRLEHRRRKRWAVPCWHCPP